MDRAMTRSCAANGRVRTAASRHARHHNLRAAGDETVGRLKHPFVWQVSWLAGNGAEIHAIASSSSSRNDLPLRVGDDS